MHSTENGAPFSSSDSDAHKMMKRILIPAICLPFIVVGIVLFSKSRAESHRTDCLNNLRQIDSASFSWAMAFNKREGDPIDLTTISVYIKGGARQLHFPSDDN